MWIRRKIFILLFSEPSSCLAARPNRNGGLTTSMECCQHSMRATREQRRDLSCSCKHFCLKPAHDHDVHVRSLRYTGMTTSLNAARFYHKADRRSRGFSTAPGSPFPGAKFREPDPPNIGNNSTSTIVFRLRAGSLASRFWFVIPRQVIGKTVFKRRPGVLLAGLPGGLHFG